MKIWGRDKPLSRQLLQPPAAPSPACGGGQEGAATFAHCRVAPALPTMVCAEQPAIAGRCVAVYE